MPDSEQGIDYRYAAFISYRHVEPDRRWAKWLHRALETYRTPKPLARQGIQARVGRVFRDEEELPASADLSKEIDLALEQSRFLIVVCSPRTPASEWVNQEVVRFREMGRHDRILALLIEGEPGASFPPALCEIRTEITNERGEVCEEIEEVEPLAADVRASRDEPRRHLERMAMLRFSAALLRCRFDDLRRREQQRQRRRMLTAGSFLLALVILLTGLSIYAFQQRARADARAREVAEERDAKTRALNEKSRALEQVLRLSDSKIARDLLAEVDELWPLHPDRADAMAAWVRHAGGLVAGLGGHEEALARMREGALPSGTPGEWAFEKAEEAWQHEVLTQLVADIESLAEPEVGVLAAVGRKRDFVTKLRKRSIEDHDEIWTDTTRAMAEGARYGALVIAPQLGLVPLGPDPDSGLYEFAHLGSGSIPSRDPETKQLVCGDDTAIVLVLLPGDTFWMGAQKRDPSGRNFDPEVSWDENDENGLPVEVTVSAFFLAKHECTQAQWRTLTHGGDPSQFKAGLTLEGETVTPRHPVEGVPWGESDRWLRRHRLRLPTEAQWEYACRAGTDTPWFTGREVKTLNGYANIADKHMQENGGLADWPYTTAVDDGRTLHAPVGSFRPNRFGLHDMHGNIYEWCHDRSDLHYYEKLARAERPERTDPAGPSEADFGMRVYRGGSWYGPADRARSSLRSAALPGTCNNIVGVRPARSVTHLPEDDE